MTTGKLFVSRHPLVIDKIARMRDKKTLTPEFRRLASEVGMLVGAEALAAVKLRPETVHTPVGECPTQRAAQDITFVTILRAGLGMTDGLMQLVPEARLAHVGIYRNEDTLEPVRYYARFPKELENHFVLLADPMLATGGSAAEAISILKSRGVKNLTFACIIAAKPGVKHLQTLHPEVPIFAGALDENLNDKGYIIPGLGDAGDRMFGTI